MNINKIYEYTFGVWVEAEDEQAAWEKVRAISEALDAVDLEGDSTTDGPSELTPTQIHNMGLRQETA